MQWLTLFQKEVLDNWENKKMDLGPARFHFTHDDGSPILLLFTRNH